MHEWAEHAQIAFWLILQHLTRGNILFISFQKQDSRKRDTNDRRPLLLLVFWISCVQRTEISRR